MIRLNDISFHYPNEKRNILDGVSLEIKEGKIYCLLGLNGCGKTTLIKNIVGLLEPNAGDIYINESNLKDLNHKERSKKIAYVSQRSDFIYDMVIREYLETSFSNSLSWYEKVNDKQREKIEECSRELGLEKLLDKKIDEISGGERQLVAICSALLQDADVLILDEPTASLDVKNQVIVLKTLKKVAKTGNTIVFTTHNPNHAKRLKANVILFDQGKIVKEESAEKLTKEDLQAVYGKNLCYSKEMSYDEYSYLDD